MQQSIRHRALEFLRDRIRGIVKDQPIEDPSPMAFARVELGPLGAPDHLKRFVCGIVAGPETKRMLYPFEECKFRVTVEFYAAIQSNETPQSICEMILLQLQLTIEADRKMGGLIVDINEIRNETDLETYGDRTAAGAIFYEVTYRHNVGDPRTLQ